MIVEAPKNKEVKKTHRKIGGLRATLSGTLLLLSAIAAPSSFASGGCEYTLGFQDIHNQISGQVGLCLDNASYNPANGDALQHTQWGMLVWRKSDNWTAFTDGYHTWVNGPNGLQERLNTERFPFEHDNTPAPIATTPALLPQPVVITPPAEMNPYVNMSKDQEAQYWNSVIPFTNFNNSLFEQRERNALTQAILKGPGSFVFGQDFRNLYSSVFGSSDLDQIANNLGRPSDIYLNVSEISRNVDNAPFTTSWSAPMLIDPTNISEIRTAKSVVKVRKDLLDDSATSWTSTELATVREAYLIKEPLAILFYKWARYFGSDDMTASRKSERATHYQYYTYITVNLPKNSPNYQSILNGAYSTWHNECCIG